jgi:electron transport complex protein RnfG
MGTLREDTRRPRPVGKKGSEFFPVIFLTLVVLISVVALTFTDSITRERIETAEEEEVREMLGEIFQAMDSFTYDEDEELYSVLKGDETIGYAFKATGKGYGGDISILVGIGDNFAVAGIELLAHQETPGLGAKIVEPSFQEQFVGLTVDEIALSRNGGKVDAITGATISSSAVVDTVRGTLLEKLSLLKEGG